MERQSGTEYRSQHDVVRRQHRVAFAERSLNGLFLIVECLAYLVGHQFTYSGHVVSEQQTVFLIVLVP